MNSFSHYGFGAVCEWMFQDLAGIAGDQPGFRHLRIRPGTVAGGGDPAHQLISWVSAAYAGITGRIACSWRREGSRFEPALAIPANTTATVLLPCEEQAGVSEDGRPLAAVGGVTAMGFAAGWLELALPSGTYRFASRVAR